jgi:hypothetical protein
MAKNTEAPNDDVFVTADTLEEAMAVREIVLKHAKWPLIFERSDGKYDVGGLTKSGGKIRDEALEALRLDLVEFAKSEATKDIDKEKFKNTVAELENDILG